MPGGHLARQPSGLVGDLLFKGPVLDPQLARDERAFEPPPKRGRARLEGGDLGNLGLGEGVPLVSLFRRGVEGSEESADLTEGEAGGLTGTDEVDAPQHPVVVDPAARHPRGLGQEPFDLVIAQRRRGQAGPLRHFSDAQGFHRVIVPDRGREFK